MLRAGVYFLGVCLLGTLAWAEVELVHLPQIHHLESIDYSQPKNYESVARSQFEMARYLLAVKAEVGVDEHVQAQALTRPFLRDARLVFPRGLPELYADLTEEQRIYLSRYGAMRVLWSLGHLRELWGATNAEEALVFELIRERMQKAWANPDVSQYSELLRVNKDYQTHLYNGRERLALQLISERLENSPLRPTRIFLAFGGTHDFTRHRREFSQLKIRREELPGAVPTMAYRGAIPEWGFSNAFLPDDQLKFYFLLLQKHPELGEDDRAYAREQQFEILNMLSRSNLKIASPTLDYLLDPSLRVVAFDRRLVFDAPKALEKPMLSGR